MGTITKQLGYLFEPATSNIIHTSMDYHIQYPNIAEETVGTNKYHDSPKAGNRLTPFYITAIWRLRNIYPCTGPNGEPIDAHDFRKNHNPLDWATLSATPTT
jgi:hypothetical protein